MIDAEARTITVMRLYEPNGRPVPNFIYRKFSSQGSNALPFASRIADLVTAENGPVSFANGASEMVRITKEGGAIILVGPEEIKDVVKSFEEAGAKVTKMSEVDSGIEIYFEVE